MSSAPASETSAEVRPLCFLIGHALALADSDSACVTSRRCRRCGARFRDSRHGALEVVTSPSDARIALLKCARCGEEISQWMTDPASWGAMRT
jgi:DNA-directed RNA polymerase subunit RPC12/RpoP